EGTEGRVWRERLLWRLVEPVASLSEDDVALSVESKCVGDFGVRLLREECSESNSHEITRMLVKVKNKNLKINEKERHWVCVTALMRLEDSA
ncbi:hypothetical protein IGI04_032013, partial [Brassica rapa subsp. trilocularis]